MSNTFNPSMRKQLKKIIDSIAITWSYHFSHRNAHHRGRLAKCYSLHIIYHLKNSKWKDTHLYFSDLEYSMKDLKRMEYEFKQMKKFFDEVEP
jgi:hypothetical protein